MTFATFAKLSVSCLCLLAGVSQAIELNPVQGGRTGLGQDSPEGPPMLRNLRLTDPLVQKKYLNEPDMLRFLRGTYSEACARGMLNQATTQIALDPQRQYDSGMRDTFKKLRDSKRIWKMSSFEMEAVFGVSYLQTAHYCDCIMKEVADTDLVNPRKGIEVVEKIPAAAQQSCERIAIEKTERQGGVPQKSSGAASKD